MRILAVDDDPDILMILEGLLAAAGHRKVTAMTDPRRALEAARRAAPPFDCVLLDIQMPGLDGIALCRALRETPAYAQVPILMVTAMATREHVEGALAAGATDYVTKPFDPLELNTRLRNAVRLHRGSGADAIHPPPPRPASRRPHGAPQTGLHAAGMPGTATRLSRQELVDLFAEDFRRQTPLKRAV